MLSAEFHQADNKEFSPQSKRSKLARQAQWWEVPLL